MSLSTQDAVKEIFRGAIRQDLQKSLRRGEDWDRYKSILRETDARLMSEQAAFKRDYPARMAEAKQIILREENGVRLDQPLPPGIQAQSDKSALERKADARVRHDHDGRIAAIKSDELEQYRNLTRDIRTRDAPEPLQSQFRGRSQSRSGPTRT